jgi:hypothetical protein
MPERKSVDYVFQFKKHTKTVKVYEKNSQGMVKFEGCCHIVVVIVVILSVMIEPIILLEAKLFGTLPLTFPCAYYVFHLLGPCSSNSCL